jgi:hypothetical protein
MSLLIIALALGAAATGGYFAGRVLSERRISRLLRTDATFSQTVMEGLASRWGAKLEMFALPGGNAPPKG